MAIYNEQYISYYLNDGIIKCNAARWCFRNHPFLKFFIICEAINRKWFWPCSYKLNTIFNILQLHPKVKWSKVDHLFVLKALSIGHCKLSMIHEVYNMMETRLCSYCDNWKQWTKDFFCHDRRIKWRIKQYCRLNKSTPHKSSLVSGLCHRWVTNYFFFNILIKHCDNWYRA